MVARLLMILALAAAACGGGTKARSHERPCASVCQRELRTCAFVARPWEGKQHCKEQHAYCVIQCYDVALFTPPP